MDIDDFAEEIAAMTDEEAEALDRALSRLCSRHRLEHKYCGNCDNAYNACSYGAESCTGWVRTARND